LGRKRKREKSNPRCGTIKLGRRRGKRGEDVKLPKSSNKGKKRKKGKKPAAIPGAGKRRGGKGEKKTSSVISTLLESLVFPGEEKKGGKRKIG